MLHKQVESMSERLHAVSNTQLNLTGTHRRPHGISTPTEIKDFPTNASWRMGYKEIYYVLKSHLYGKC